MAIKLASLFIEIGANGDRLTAELKKSSKSTRNWAREIDKSTKQVRKSFTLVTAGAGVATAGLTALYLRNSQTLDSLGKTASKLGDTTQDLRVFGIAANLGGVGVDSANTALQRMTRRVAEAAQGTGEARGAIEELGLDAQELVRMRPSEAFETIAEVLQTIPLEADRVRLAMKFFDSEGVALVNVTTQALQTAKDTVEAFGGAVNSLEVGQIEAANDAVLKVQTGFGLLSDKITVKLAPGVKEVADQLFLSASNAGELEVAIDGLIVSSISGIGSFSGAMAGLLTTIEGREEIIEYGVLGYLLFGKKGAVVGGLLGSVADTIEISTNRIKGFFDESVSEVELLERELHALETTLRNSKENVSFLGESAGNFVNDLFYPSVPQLQADIQRVQDKLVELGASPEESGFVSSLATIFQQAALSSEKLVENYGKLPTSPTVVQPFDVVPIDLSNAANDSGEDPEDPEETEAQRKLKILNAYFSQRLSDEQRFQRALNAFKVAGKADRLNILFSETAEATAGLAQYSRTVFEINKAAGLANAAVSIATGVAKALELGFPQGILAAIEVGLEGAAQIRTINEAKFGSGSVTTPGVSSGSSVTAVSSVGSTNTDAANDAALTSDVGISNNNVVFFGFHTEGASEEQKADEQARLFQIAQDNDLLVPNDDGTFSYTGTGTSNYVAPEFSSEAVG